MVTIGPKIFTQADLARIDQRIIPYITGWEITETYKYQKVVLPDYIPFNYFEDLDKQGDVSEYEKQLMIWCGWAGRSNGKDIDGLYDSEVLITLAIYGTDTISGRLSASIHYEILKNGGAPIQVFFNKKLVTDFQDSYLFFKVTNGYQAGILNRFLA